jgi:glycogen debranching enzyme
MDDVIQVQDQFYILATASKSPQRHAVLKHDDAFAVFDISGDIGAFGPDEQGLYYEGTRYLSQFRMRMNGQRPLLLSARVKHQNELFGADLTNPDLPLADDRVLAHDLVHVFRGRFLWNATWHERIRLWNYSRGAVPVSLAFDVDADFADIFEVRGTKRDRRGTRQEPVASAREIRFVYRGLDDEVRTTVMEWSDAPAAVSPHMVRFDYDLPPHGSAVLTLSVRCDRARRASPPIVAYEIAEQQSNQQLEETQQEYATFETSSERFDEWLRRSAADMRMLVSNTPHGRYPYAGVPWFSTPFGRDGIIAALQMLWVNPEIARGVLSYLAATQADRVDEARDAEPGKILHETRTSEMANLGEVPFGCYYGSIDATPLFVILAGKYFERTDDRAFLSRLWPHVERALEWIDRYGDRDGDGFVEYARQSPSGLVQQGWKDSQDSVFHADGALAEPPIALCEVQAYVFDAWQNAATMADALGKPELAARLRRRAHQLQAAFEERFWCEEEGTYALALDGRKQPCRVLSSNAGHCLFGGIASPERARRVAEQLVGGAMFSGWGIRTISPSSSRYNPMSYHNGSVWPHDNGIIAEGFARYGFDDLIGPPFAGLFDASGFMEGRRLPELFCGFHRRSGEGPTLYPVACSPQAWAAGVVFQLMQASLRLSIDPPSRRLCISRARLPTFLSYARLCNLKLPFGRADLLFERHPGDVGVTVLGKTGDFEISVLK